MRRSSVRQRLSLGLILMSVLALAVPSSVAALSVYSASIMNSYCSGSYNWAGDLPYDNAADTHYYQTTGTVKYCFWVYRATDTDSTADYYLVAERVNWTVTYDGATRGDNYGMITMDSSISAKGGVKDGDPDHNVSYNSNCSTTLGLSADLGPFGVSVSELFCPGGKLNLTWLGNDSARWGSPDVTGTPKWEVAYLIKVGQGQKPTLTATLGIPRYNIWRDSQTLYWHYGKNWTNLVHSYKIP